MKRIVLFFLVLVSFGGQVLPAKNVSEQAKVVLFTCGPGEELYAGFGHSALWISDPIANIDRLYNYGTFDFNTPGFYTKFVRGQLDYMLSATTVRRFLNEYTYRKIEVDGQTLNLNQPEIQHLYELLEDNLKEENRFYRYDFFYDNCATRLWDMVELSTDGNAKLKLDAPNQSFRELLFPYLEHKPWVKLGINLVLGLSSDKQVSAKEAMYLPAFLNEGFASSTISDGRNLVENEKEYIPAFERMTTNWVTHPVTIFSFILFLLIFLSYREYKKMIHYQWIDTALMILGVVSGVFLLFMWLGTDHSATNYNLNCFWLIPAQLAFLLRSSNKKVLGFTLIYTIFITIAMLVWPQKSEFSFLLISLLFLVRFISKWNSFNKKEK